MTDFMTDLWKDVPNARLKNYVPDVYQLNIFMIDYDRLVEKGIKLITFDVDDTIVSKSSVTLPKAVIVLFTELKNMGFEIMLLSNAGDSRVQGFAERTGVGYIARAKKPSITHFEAIRNRYQIEKSQMAHIGNSIVNDVAGGNSFGITTCLVRPISHEKNIATELSKRGMWHKHHIDRKGDQYYQLGEKQKGSI